MQCRMLQVPGLLALEDVRGGSFEEPAVLSRKLNRCGSEVFSARKRPFGVANDVVQLPAAALFLVGRIFLVRIFPEDPASSPAVGCGGSLIDRSPRVGRGDLQVAGASPPESSNWRNLGTPLPVRGSGRGA